MTDISRLVIEVDSKGVKRATDELEKLGIKAKKAQTDTDGLAKSTGGMSRKAAQAGVQVEQLVGQIAAGGNAAQAFAYQAADLGIVLGAPLVGAVVGISATIAGLFLPSLLKGDKAIEDMIPTVDKLIEKMSELSYEEASYAILKTTERLSENKSELSAVKNRYDSLTKSVKNYGSYISTEDKQYKEKNKQLLETGVLLKQLQSENAELTSTLKTLNEVQSGTYEGNKKDRELKTALALATQSVTASLRGQVIALEDGAKAAFEYNVAQSLGLKEGEELPKVIQDQVDAIYKAQDAKAADVKAAREQAEALSFVDSVIRQGMDAYDMIESKMDSLTEKFNAGLIPAEKYNAAMAILGEQAAKAFDGENIDPEPIIEKVLTVTDVVEDAGKRMAVGIGDAVATSITEAKDFGEAAKAVAKGAIESVISGLVQVGIQETILSNLRSALKVKETTETTAQMTTIASASLPAATGVTLATGGSNAASASILVPALAGMLGGLILGQRAEGGTMSAGGAYQINERGQEIFVPNQNGRMVSNEQIEKMISGSGSGGSFSQTVVVNEPIDEEALIEKSYRYFKYMESLT